MSRLSVTVVLGCLMFVSGVTIPCTSTRHHDGQCSSGEEEEDRSSLLQRRAKFESIAPVKFKDSVLDFSFGATKGWYDVPNIALHKPASTTMKDTRFGGADRSIELINDGITDSQEFSARDQRGEFKIDLKGTFLISRVVLYWSGWWGGGTNDFAVSVLNGENKITVFETRHAAYEKDRTDPISFSEQHVGQKALLECRGREDDGYSLYEIEVYGVEATCAMYSCPDNYRVKNPNSATYTEENCCQATCALFSCPNNYLVQNYDSTAYTDANCCKAQTSCKSDGTEYQNVPFFLTCLGTPGNWSGSLEAGSTKVIATIPAGTDGASITLSGTGDLDLKLFEGSSCLAGYDCKLNLTGTMSGPGDITIQFSGDDSDADVEETITITGHTDRELEFRVTAFANFTGNGSYDAGPISPCNINVSSQCSPCSSYTGCSSGKVPTCDGATSVSCGADRRIVFAPLSADAVGVFDTSTNSFSAIGFSRGTLPRGFKFSGAAAVGTKVVFAPNNADAVGVFDTSTNSFSASVTTVPPCHQKFGGAAAVGTKVVFAPFNADAVGVFDTSTNSFSSASVPTGTLSMNGKFMGAAAVGTKVVFAPFNADAVGVFDTITNSFSAISFSVGTFRHGWGKFAGAAAVGTKVVFAPHVADAVGVFDTSTNSFSASVTTGTLTMYMKFMGAAAVGTKVVFAPYHADAVGVFDTSTNSFSAIGFSRGTVPKSDQGEMSEPPGPEYFGGAAAMGTKVVFAPKNAHAVGVFDTSTNSFSASVLTETSYGYKFEGAAAGR